MPDCMVVMHGCLFMMHMQCNSNVRLVGGQIEFDSSISKIRELYTGKFPDGHCCREKSLMAEDYLLTLLGERNMHDWFEQK